VVVVFLKGSDRPQQGRIHVEGFIHALSKTFLFFNTLSEGSKGQGPFASRFSPFEIGEGLGVVFCDILDPVSDSSARLYIGMSAMVIEKGSVTNVRLVFEPYIGMKVFISVSMFFFGE